MPAPGFTDPALASIPPAGNLYFGQDLAVAAKIPADAGVEPRGPGHVQARDLYHGGNMPDVPRLMFPGATTGSGEAIVHAAGASRGHWTEITNFHGSPAPWILIGILIVAGLLHLEASGKVKL